MTIFGIHIDIDTLVFIATTLVMVVKWLVERTKLPAYIQRYVDAIGEEQVADWVKQAASYQGMTSAQKHEFVAGKIENYAEKRLKIDIPRSFVDIIVKFVYKKLGM
jgi:hypothetical protein